MNIARTIMAASRTSTPEMGESTFAKRGFLTLTEVEFGGDDLAPLLISQFLSLQERGAEIHWPQ